MDETHGVRYVTLQLRGPFKEWWRTYLSSTPYGTSSMTLEIFTNAFYDQFVPWSVREESPIRFKHLR